MNQLLHIVCPHCLAVNRIPADRLQAGPKCGKCRGPLFSARPLALTATGFQRHVSRSDIPLLVDFWASWCGPCKMMAPAYEKACEYLEPSVRLAKVDTEEQHPLALQYNIRNIPTLVLFRDGHEIARQPGAMMTPDIVQWTRRHLE